jgi:amino acid permease
MEDYAMLIWYIVILIGAVYTTLRPPKNLKPQFRTRYIAIGVFIIIAVLYAIITLFI